MKRFGVNVERHITLYETVYVRARDEDDARAKVQDQADAGHCGYVNCEVKEARKSFKEAEVGEEQDEDLVVEDAFESKED